MLRKVIIAMSLAAVLAPFAQAVATVPDAIAKDIHDGYFRRALTQLRPLMDAHGKEADFQFQCRTALAGTNKFEEGLQALKAAVALVPGDLEELK